MNFETWLQSDLTKPLKVQALHGVFFSADNAANLIGAEVYDGGAPASLSGTCIGYAIRADGGTLTITGTVSGNKASIILPTSAYVIEGPLDIVIKVISGSVKTTVGACRGYVQRATTDTIIDPGHVIPSLEELLAQIDACEQATDAANTAASNANSKATAANTAATNANTATGNANTATTRANTAAAALENMDATASGLAAGATPTATVSTVNNHYRIAFGIPKGDKGDKGDTGAAATITNTATAYQNSTSGTTIPTGTWQTTQPDTPQGQFLWIRTILTWNNGQTSTLYSVSRMGIDGSGSVVSVNDISPDANGNVTLDVSGDVHTVNGIAPDSNKNITLPVDATPTSGSTNPVTSGGVYTGLDGKQDKLTLPLAINQGGTGATTAAAALTNLGAASSSTVGIVATGTTAPQAITAGQYVIWQGSLYTAKSNIASGATLSTANLTAVSGGGLNALNTKISGRNPKTLLRPLTVNQTTDWTYTAPHDGTLFLTYISKVRHYTSVNWNGAYIGAFSLPTYNEQNYAQTMSIPMAKGDSVSVTGLSPDAYLIQTQTAFIANGVDV